MNKKTKKVQLPTILDIELTLNRFNFGWIQPNKFQFGCFRVGWWNGRKVSIGFEVNWQTREHIIIIIEKEVEPDESCFF